MSAPTEVIGPQAAASHALEAAEAATFFDAEIHAVGCCQACAERLYHVGRTVALTAEILEELRPILEALAGFDTAALPAPLRMILGIK